MNISDSGYQNDYWGQQIMSISQYIAKLNDFYPEEQNIDFFGCRFTIMKKRAIIDVGGNYEHFGFYLYEDKM